MKRATPLLLLAALALSTNCTALQELAALRSVVFAYDHLDGVRVAGLAVTERTAWSSLSVADAARVAAAVATGTVPLQFTAHVKATNPAENKVAARLVRLGWTLFVDEQRILQGEVADPIAIAPGASGDVPVAVQFDLMQLAHGGARDLFDTARGIAGYGGTAKPLRFELVPTVDTSLGPITYPNPITIRR